MSAHVLLNLLNKFRNLFHNKFNKFNNTRALMFYHMTLRIL